MLYILQILWRANIDVWLEFLILKFYNQLFSFINRN